MLGSLGLERRAIQATPWGSWGTDDNGSTWSGQQVSQTTALSLSAVYGCVRVITDQISTLPIQVFRQTTGHKIELPRPSWLVEPVVGLSYVGWLSQILSSLLLQGNAYLAVTYNDPGQIVELVPLDPTKITVKRVAGRRTFYVNGVPATSQILHIQGMMLPGTEVGLSPVEYARQTIGLGLAQIEHGARFFGQGMTLSGVIEVPQNLPAGKPAEMARLWARKHSGTSKAHLPGVLEGGAHWVSNGVTNEQAQFLDSRKFSAVEIAGQWFGVDPTDLGLENKGSSLTYANLEQRSTHRVQMTLMPWIIRVEHALSALLPQPRFVKMNVDALLRGDSQARWVNYKTASEINTAAAAVGMPPVLLTAEMRQFEDMDPIPGELPVAPDPAAETPAPLGG